MVFRASERVGIAPALGVRAKLTAKGVGRWKDSAGYRAKFGLTSAEIVEVVDRLAERNLLQSLQLLHFHIGSQVSSIIPFKNAIAEAANIFVELAKMGANMRYMDVGGGLAVDYDGSKTDFHASKNYNIQEYANDVVFGILDACSKANVPVPTIVTESGRAVTAHQSVLIFQVVGTNDVRFDEPAAPPPNAHPVLRGLYDTWKNIVPKNVQEAWHDASQAKEEAQSLFKFGYVGLRERAQAEKLYWSCCVETCRRSGACATSRTSCVYPSGCSPPSTTATSPSSSPRPTPGPSTSLPHHADPPAEGGADRTRDVRRLTCDSDGAIDHFIDREDVKNVLEVHPVAPPPYYMGLFLNGAYQEILGDLHNLFGDTNAVHVRLSEGPGYHIAHVVKGDSVAEVRTTSIPKTDDMVERVRQQAEAALRTDQITLPQMRLLMRHYEDSLGKYTYLSDDSE